MHKSLLISTAFFATVSVAQAGTITVTSNADAGANSLRQAIIDTNVGDTIEFSGVTSITLATGSITIEHDLIIDGGAGVTIDAANNNPIFYVDTGTDFEINDLVLLNGAGGYGAAVENRGNIVTITRCTMSGNSANNAGALSNFGTLHLIDSTVSGNSTTGNSGAGFINSGVMTIVNSTISGNTVPGATRVGGGGGQFADDASLTISHSTIANNSAAGSGGGLYVGGGTVQIRNSIIADNTASAGPDIWGAVTSEDYNIIEDTSDATIGGTTTNDITGTDPMLGVLGDNGGPTQTMAVPAASAAYSSGVCTDIEGSTVGTDQRGMTRPAADCTRGAYDDTGPTCDDSIQNQDESDIDCGGANCAACANGDTCTVNSDCASEICDAGSCVAELSPTCDDGIQNQDESDIDCGGANCAACVNGGMCTVNGDCASEICNLGTCAVAIVETCDDGIQNQNETDIDCGGGCAACSDGGGGCSSVQQGNGRLFSLLALVALVFPLMRRRDDLQSKL